MRCSPDRRLARRRLGPLGALLLALPLLSSAWAVASSFDDQARLLAGMPVAADSPLAAVEQTAAWQEHEQELREMWDTLEAKRLGPMREWTTTELQPRIDPGRPLVYIFGGPDFLGAGTFFPSAPLYVLAGLERVGRLPAPETLQPAALATALRAMRHSLHSVVDTSFFITSKMSADLDASEMKGVLPLLFLFLARTGNTVVDSRYVYIAAGGTLVEYGGSGAPADAVPGVQIRFCRGDQALEQELFYFRLDLADKQLPAKPGFYPYLTALGPCNSFLKAASFILFDPAFSRTKRFLVEQSATILQDDSGLPFRTLARGPWDLAFFGEYSAPRNVFKNYFQPDLKRAFAEATPGPLPFRIGYLHEGSSSLVLAVRKPPAASQNAANNPR